MAGVSRHVNVTLENEGRPIKLKKWSVAKFFVLVDLISEVADKFVERFVTTDPATGRWLFLQDPKQISSALKFLGAEGLSRVTRIIKESIDEPAIDEAAIGEWDFEDCVAVLKKIFEINLSQGALKNLASLRGVVPTRIPEAVKTASSA